MWKVLCGAVFLWLFRQKTASEDRAESLADRSSAGSARDRSVDPKDTGFEESRRQFRSKFARTLVLSAFLVVVVLAEANVTLVSQGQWQHIELDVALEVEEALALTLGLATLVAALAIALTAGQLSPDRTPPRLSAAHAVWADQTAFATTIASMIAVVVGALQLLSIPPRTEWAATGATVVVAILSAWLSAAVVTWHGEEELYHWSIRRRLAVLQEELNQLNTVLCGAKRSRSYRRYAAFVFGIGLTAMILTRFVSALARIASGQQFMPLVTWDFVLGVLGLSCLALGTVWLVINYWLVKVVGDVMDRLVFAFMFLLVAAVWGLLLAVAAVDEGNLSALVAAFVLWASVFLLPPLLLLRARKVGSGPGVFALYWLVQACERRRAAFEEALKEGAADSR